MLFHTTNLSINLLRMNINKKEPSVSGRPSPHSFSAGCNFDTISDKCSAFVNAPSWNYTTLLVVYVAKTGLEPATWRLWAFRATTAPPRLLYYSLYVCDDPIAAVALVPMEANVKLQSPQVSRSKQSPNLVGALAFFVGFLKTPWPT